MSAPRAARPVLKWAGGKTQLLSHVLERLPERIETYYEPFVGGAAVFFALASAERFKRAVLSDRNDDLIAVYSAIKRDVEGVIRRLKRLKYDEQQYYEVRAQKPRELCARAARTIYLNKTGYNGLYRVNRSGQFNVPFGRYKHPKICDEENLRRAAQALSRVELRVASFDEVARRAKPGDAVYFDPPYLPVSRTANFTAYDRHPFGVEQHERLAEVFGELASRGVLAVLSNSDTRVTRELYREFHVQYVSVSRPINSNKDARGPISEILAVNRQQAKRSRRAPDG